MNEIRPFCEADIPRVAELHRVAMSAEPGMTPALLEAYREWLTSAFLANPMRAAGFESLVSAEGSDIIGFIGVVPRLMSLNGVVYRATLGTNFCVHPSRRGPAGLRLFKAYLSCGQDLAFSDEMSDRARELAERFGGTPSTVQSVHWVLPLRPAERLMARVRHRLPGSVGWVGRHVARAVDVVTRRLPRSPLRFEQSTLLPEPLTMPELGRLLKEFGSPRDLRPVTSDGSTAWLVDRARRNPRHGELVMTSLRNARGEVAGWYIYYANPGGQGEVLQLVAARGLAEEVLDQLVYDAGIRDIVSLAGVLHPAFLQPLSQRGAVLESGTRWMTVHAKNPELLEAFWRGNILLSRLDGEWCLHFS